MQENGFSVLLVDDEEEFLTTLVKRMQKRNINVCGVGSGTAAIEFLKNAPVDIVVLDVKMPDMNGIEALRMIKKEHPATEVIMLTGHANVEVAIQGMELGAFDYLMKPIDIDDLLFKLQDAHKKKTIHGERLKAKKEKNKEGD